MREPDRPPRGARRRGFLFRLAVSVGLLLLLLLFVDWGRLGARLGAANAAPMLAVVLLATADRLLMAWKWWLLVQARDVTLGLWPAVRAYYLASFAGYFLPIVWRAFFRPVPEGEEGGIQEAPWPCVAALSLTALLTIALFFFPQTFVDLASAVAAGTGGPR